MSVEIFCTRKLATAPSATVTVWSSSWSTMLGVPLVKVRVEDLRFGLLLSALNHWMAPATLVRLTPFCVLASSWVR